MTISLRKAEMALIFVLTTALFVFFILFDTYTQGKYTFLGLSICIFMLGCRINHKRSVFRFDLYVILNILFIGFVLFSSLWAINTSDSVTMARTLMRVFICAYMVYVTYLNTPGLDETMLLKSIMWAGYIVALYSLSFYGLDKMIVAGRSSGLRIKNDFSNVNTIGMACALSCVIQINIQGVSSKEHLLSSALFMIPSIIVIAATQSKKALVFLIAGAIGYAFVNAQKSKKRGFTKIIKILFWILILGFIFYWILQLDTFDGVLKRMKYMLNTVSGNGRIDSSTMIRKQFKELGLEWFVKYPIGGIGVANPHILTAQYYNYDTYLHDNFVELLCGGGLVGFSLYYSMYVYLFVQLWKYRKINPQRVTFFAIWLGLMLVMDYGRVSYYSKSTNFYLMIHFLNVFRLRQKAVLEKGDTE